MEYEIIYSKRKSLALQITRECKIIVRAPLRASKKDISEFVSKHRDWILSHLELMSSHNKRYPEPSEDEYNELMEKAKAILPERVKHFSKIMGVSPLGVSINRAKTRFGSCSSKGKINFSCRLMRYPNEAIDYVVVHELAHLKFLNHSKSFWAFVEKFMPDYKERKKLLK